MNLRRLVLVSAGSVVLCFSAIAVAAPTCTATWGGYDTFIRPSVRVDYVNRNPFKVKICIPARKCGSSGCERGHQWCETVDAGDRGQIELVPYDGYEPDSTSRKAWCEE